MIDELSVSMMAAFGLDRILGDPRWLPHPVRLIGRVTVRLEPLLTRLFGRNRSSGTLLAAMVAGGAYFAVWGILNAAERFDHRLTLILTVYFLYSALAARDLDQESMKVFRSLQRGDRNAARKDLSMIVGRSTDQLNEREIVRGAVETIAEGTVDGILSPLFFAVLGGAPLAMAFKAANTLDSMTGHRDERYIRFGWASARLDDLLNLVPARVARFFYPVASLLCGLNAARCWSVSWRDGRKSPSPNAAISEAAVAGALGVQLGGVNIYQGKAEKRPHLGDALRDLEPRDIPRAVKWMYATSIIGLAFFTGIRAFILSMEPWRHLSWQALGT